MNADSRLNRITRSANLQALEHTSTDSPLDLLVVGGGVTGAASAMDASLRGMHVGLVEQGDFAQGASSASSRLAHGGLRYLEQGHLRLVAEALRERRMLVQDIAPTLSRRLDFILPARTWWELLYMRVGVALYDLLAWAFGGRIKGAHSHLIGRARLSQLAPSIDAHKYRGAVRFSDAQIDDARHTIAVMRTAQLHGARVVSHAKAVGVHHDQTRTIRVDVDVDGNQVAVYTRSVLFACGAWSNDWSQELAGTRIVRPSKGTHIVVPRDAISMSTALISRTRKSVLFILPWAETWIIGTTDEEYDEDPSLVQPTAAERDYLLEQVNHILLRPLTTDQVIGMYAGLRPLTDARASNTTDVSREHHIVELTPNVFAITGGKYTTYRVMAQDAINIIQSRLSDEVIQSQTSHVKLIDSAPDDKDAPPEYPAAPLRFTPNHTPADVWRAVMIEGAWTADDVFARRWRLVDPSADQVAEVEEFITRLRQQ